MNRKQFLILFVLTLIPFLVLQLRPDMVGDDTYYYLNQICNGHPAPDYTIFSTWIMQILPCNFLALKMILFALCFSSVIAIALLGELFYYEKGWLAGVFVFLSPLIVIEFIKLENDQFAFPLLFWSLYFLYRGVRLHDRRNFIISFALLVIGGLIWNGAIYYAIVFIPICIFFSVILIYVFYSGMQRHLMYFFDYTKWNLVESQSLIAIPFFAMLIFGLFGLPLETYIPFAILAVISLVSVKFAILAIPFLALGFVGFYSSLKINFKAELFFSLVFFCAIGWGIMSLNYPPSANDLEAVHYVIQEAKGAPISNDWDIGHWINYYGGKAKNSGTPEQEIYSGITISAEDLNCARLKKFDHYAVFDCK